MLEMLEQSLKVAAGFLPKPWKEYTVDELADMACVAMDEHDEFGYESAFSGIMLHMQPYIVKLYKENGAALKLEPDDFASWMSGAITMAVDPSNRTWQKKNIKAGTVILQILLTRFKAAAYYDSNLAIHRANYNTASLDELVDDDAECPTYKVDLLASNEPSPSEQFGTAHSIIQELLDANRIIEAIIADTIANNECYKTETKTISETREDGTVYKYKKTSYTFWPYKVVKILNTLSTDYAEKFAETYSVSLKKLEIGLKKIKESSNTKLRTYLKKTQTRLGSYL